MLVLKRIFVGLIFSTLTLVGCKENGALIDTANVVNQKSDDWIVSGEIANEGYENGEVVAMAVDGTRYRTGITEQRSFGVELPGNSTYAVYFLPAPKVNIKQVIAPSGFIDSAVGPTFSNGTPALLNFEESPEIGLRDTLRLPEPGLSAVLDLGEINIQGENAYPTINPASSLDFDNDGIVDAVDPDDQNDGLSDPEQRERQEKVEICHRGTDGDKVTLSVALASLFAHIDHGDRTGSCEENANEAPRSPVIIPPGLEIKQDTPAANEGQNLPVNPNPPANPWVNDQIIFEEDDSEDTESDSENDSDTDSEGDSDSDSEEDSDDDVASEDYDDSEEDSDDEDDADATYYINDDGFEY